MVKSVDETFADIVTGSKMIDAQFIGQLLQKWPFEVIVTERAGHRGMSGHVFADKIINDCLSEHIANVVGDMLDFQSFT